jgi:hypothetical protein
MLSPIFYSLKSWQVISESYYYLYFIPTKKRVDATLSDFSEILNVRDFRIKIAKEMPKLLLQETEDVAARRWVLFIRITYEIVTSKPPQFSFSCAATN